MQETPLKEFLLLEQQAQQMQSASKDTRVEPNTELNQNEPDEDDSFIAIEELAMRDEENSNINFINKLQNENKNLSNENNALKQKLKALESLNSDLSLKVTENNNSFDIGSTNSDGNQPDQLICRINALEMQLAASQNENEHLVEEIKSRENNFIDEISRLSQEISKMSCTNMYSPAQNDSQNQKAQEITNEVLLMQNQIKMMLDNNTSMSESLKHEISEHTKIFSKLLETKKCLSEQKCENEEKSVHINSLLQLTNSQNVNELIHNIRRLMVEENEAKKATEQLCLLQIRFSQEAQMNVSLRKELENTKTRLLESISSSNEKVSFDDENEVKIRDLKAEYERRLSVERERTQNQQNLLEDFKNRNKQISQRFASLQDQTELIHQLSILFAELENPNYQNALEDLESIALTLVPREMYYDVLNKLQIRENYLIKIDEQTKGLSERLNTYIAKYKKTLQNHAFRRTRTPLSEKNNRFSQRRSNPSYMRSPNPTHVHYV